MRRLPVLLVCLCLLLAACGQQAPEAAPSPAPLPEPTAAPADPWGASSVKVYVDGLLRLRGYACEGTLYLCPADLCALFGLDVSTAISEEGCTLSLPQGTLDAPADSAVYTFDGRYLYCPEGYRVEAGRVYFPADVSARLFGLKVSSDGARADVDTSGFQLLRGGEDYYASHIHPDDLFWLSHIIYAEAHWEPLEGQLGVGNVVLNRVRSELFPATVMGVVLDREHTVQFDPVESGAIGAQPDETALMAACLCFEGYNPVGDSLYFMNPALGDATWFENALTETVRIGNHVFYS